LSVRGPLCWPGRAQDDGEHDDDDEQECANDCEPAESSSVTGWRRSPWRFRHRRGGLTSAGHAAEGVPLKGQGRRSDGLSCSTWVRVERDTVLGGTLEPRLVGAAV
jgi:hypothetical protein